MDTPDFVKGNYNTHFIEKNKKFLEQSDQCKGDCKAMAIIAAFVDYQYRLEKAQPSGGIAGTQNKWKTAGRRMNLQRL